MSAIEGLFSIRLVTADFYLEKPCLGLDPCYSELRGKEIKKVPIIRIFGPNSNGQKTSVHVHGVFPYFYIPYEKKDFATLERGIFQIATHLDKAINISLGQGSGNAQHVFKIQLVKGIPFYGYHRSEHQFLKIYMLNPRFVRRAANLLQNGAILNKNFNPHESHVPYILQFMIDYNLYGMSFLHVPEEVVKFRRNSDEESVPYSDVQSAQLLDTTLYKKITCSELEVDIASNFILNRFQLITKSNNMHTNPGIEAIWHDERLRRQKLAQSIADEKKLNAIPALEVPPTQERPNVEIAESEIFFRSSLVSKLLVMENSMMASGSVVDNTTNATLSTTIHDTNVTLNATISAKEQRRTFNLKKLLANAVYPEECTQEDKLINASFIENHLSNNSTFKSSSLSQLTNKSHNQLNSSEDVFSEDTIVDEELVLSLTQPHVPMDLSLQDEDFQLLDVLQQLEDQNTEYNQVDLDSSLAPLSQHHNRFELTPEILDKETMAAAANLPISTSDSENENEDDGNNVHDFSMALDDIDELLLKITQSQTQQGSPTKNIQDKMPQIDGSDDLLQRTPKKEKQVDISKKSPSRTPKTPKLIGERLYKTPTRSPRTPKRDLSARYAPLALVYSNKSAQKTCTTANNITPTKPHSNNADRLSLQSESKLRGSAVSLRKKLAVTELRRKSITVSKEDCIISVLDAKEDFSKKTPAHRRRRTLDLDKTHITCSLAPRRKSERILKVYTPNKESKLKNVEKTTPDMLKDSSPTVTPTIRRSLRNKELNYKESAVAAIAIKKSEKPKISNSKEIDACFLPTTFEQTSSLDKTHKESYNKSTAKLCKNFKVRVQNMKLGQIKEKMSVSEDEIIVSDTEAEVSRIQLSKTPNLRRLRRSFRESLFVKHNKAETKRINQDLCGTSKPRNTYDDFSCSAQQINSVYEAKSPRSSPCLSEESNDNEPTLMQSFYDQSFLVNSPSMFSEDVPSPLLPFNDVANKTPTISNSALKTTTVTESSNCTNSAADGKVIVTPLDLPPSYDEVVEGCRKFNIHEHEFQQPFYSNPDDITKMKEVGFTVLQISGNKLNDCQEFESLLSCDEILCLKDWRHQQLIDIGGPTMANRYRNAARVREYFTTCTKAIIAPQEVAPTKQDAKIWLKARELLIQKEHDMNEEKRLSEDSPIKVRRQKVTMMMNEDGVCGDSDTEDLDSASLTLTPMTPGTPLQHSQDMSNVNASFTPLTINIRDSSVVSHSRVRRSARRARISLNDQLNVKKTETNGAINIRCIASEQLLTSSSSDKDELPSSQKSVKSESSESSLTSQDALAELERTSFVRHLQQLSGQHDISFGLTNATLNNTFGFKVKLENLEQAKADIEYNYLTTMTLELFVPTRDNLHPDPMHDELRCMFYAIEHSIPSVSNTQKSQLPTKACGYIIVNDQQDIVSEGRIHGIEADIEVRVAKNEMEALEALLELIERWDPDIYAGYEIEMSSWGYVIDRAKYLCFNIVPMLSRVPTQKVRDFVDEDRDHFTDLDIEMKICGRIMLDVWRLMRSEIALTSYTFENVIYHILHKRCPWHSYRNLTDWFASPCSRWIVIEYYLERVRGSMALLHQLDLIGRTSEMAKLIGIQFYEVLSRGSQFRVESMMLRIAKPKNLVPLSPSVQQRAHARAPEYLALIMEPQSRFYADPLIVLDFQSLYPSMIIAYNYCFSTCLGRVEHLGQSTPFEFGASQLRVSPVMLKKLLDRDLVTISPCGVVFVKSAVREGILPRMLTEILDTRQMVKQSMKLHKNNTALQRILHSRQLGLKLMANVTYGYTAANFSGRMPSVEVGDTIVAKARETLERAIKMVETNEKWNVRVVYGDTDSMFVLVPGRNREQAFKIGEEIADAVTKQNPHPVKLKLEKVYQPCILQTKKRYVGYMYETPDQTEPVYEAKGIETVRRDGCPAVAKMLEKVLRILFETADVSQVKQYVCRQFTKLLSGRANLQDLIFAKEFRGLNGYKPTACVPALEMTRKWLQTDPRHIPRRGERVPFIIINGPPGVPLIRLVRSPHELLSDEGYKINAIYYITKAIIPPLNRCLLLIGADVNEWFTNLPRKILLTPALSNASELKAKSKNFNQLKKSTISQYFSNTNCVIDCGRQTKQGICSVCVTDATKCFAILQTKIAKCERGFQLTQQICQVCCGRVGDLNCGSLDCPVLYVLEVKRRELQQIEHFRKLLDTCF